MSCQLVLKDKDRLSKQNALTICDYVIAMNEEINPGPVTRKTTYRFSDSCQKMLGLKRSSLYDRHDSLSYLDKHPR